MIQSFKMALRSISSNKLRSVLTMLGIIIGVMALVILVSLVSGATNSVTDTIAGLGSNLITVTVSDDKGSPIQLSTLNEWAEDSPEIGALAPYSTAYITAKYGTENGSVTVYGTTPSYYDIQNLTLTQGRFLKNTDIDNHTNVCIISESTANELIGYTDCIGTEISLDGMKYTVVGVLSDGEESLMSMFSDGMVAYIPYTSMLRLSSTISSDVTTFCVSAADGTLMEAAKAAITDLLLERFDEDEDAFYVSSIDALEEATSSITSILAILLGGIAGISLIVGGIGIMNIMLVTVTERTREIGIRKAIGATRGMILRQFLLEAVVLCMLGCIIGIFLSWGILQLLSVVVSSLDITFRLEGTVVLISVIFCFLIGIVFGLYPANKAAKMKPIDALHYGG